MIASITGTLAATDERSVTLLTQGGVGYRLFTTADTLHSLEKDGLGIPLTLYTYLAVRENALDLYGFMHQTDVRFFELLLTVSGIGPKTALSVMSAATPGTLHQAITSGNTGILVKTSGLGKKMAEKIVLELKDKHAQLALAMEPGTVAAAENVEDHDTIEALKTLGYSYADAREALKNVPSTIQGASARIKEALKQLS
jgi:Holliday junction DNA helicase RuvA